MKTLLKISIGVFFIILIGLFGCYLGRNALIKTVVEKAGTKILETNVSLANVDFQPFQGHILLKNLRIANPKGFSKNDLFSLGQITVDLQPRTLLSNKIIINKISIDSVSALYEIENGRNNISVLQKNITGDTKPQEQNASPSSAKGKENSPKTVIIKDFTLKNSKVSASIGGVGMTLPLPPIHMTDIGEDNPSTFKDILTSVINVFSAETLNAITTATTEAVKSGADALGKMLKKLF